MPLVQCAREGDGAKFEPARMILADSTAVATQTKTQNRSRGSSLAHPQTKTNDLISAHADASGTMLMGGRLGHVPACLEDPGRFYGRGRTGPNTDFLKIGYPKTACLDLPSGPQHL
jgi:hypothetical protein